MSRIVRAALTQTRNAYADMPRTVAELDSLSSRLDDVRAANVAHHVELLAHAAGRGVKVIGFGELFPGPYFALEEREMWRGLAEDALEGPTVREIQRAAREHSVIVVAPIYELDATSGECFNTAVLISETGEILGRYRKTHIPFGSNEKGSFSESFYYRRSDGNMRNDEAHLVSNHPCFPVFETSVGAVGVAICYDRHFEGVMSSLAAGGAEIVFSPAVTFGDKSRRMWPQEFATDAMRHGLFIGGSNRIGFEPPWEIEYFGESHFVGPNCVLPNVSDHDELIICDLDLDEVESDDPSGWNLARDRRPGIYG